MFILQHVLPDGKRGMTHEVTKRQLRYVLATLRELNHQNWRITRWIDGVIIAQSKTFTIV